MGLSIGVLRNGEAHFHGFGAVARGGGAPDRDTAFGHKVSWFTLDKRTRVRLTWIVSQLPEGGRVLRTSVGTWGFAGMMVAWPGKKRAVILLANKANDTAHGRLGEIAARIAALPPE